MRIMANTIFTAVIIPDVLKPVFHQVQFASSAGGFIGYLPIPPAQSITWYNGVYLMVGDGIRLGEEITLLLASHAGYTFSHWTSNQRQGQFTTAEIKDMRIMANTTFTAVFVPYSPLPDGITVPPGTTVVEDTHGNYLITIAGCSSTITLPQGQEIIVVIIDEVIGLNRNGSLAITLPGQPVANITVPRGSSINIGGNAPANPVLLGDVNGDGRVDIVDVLILLRYMSGHGAPDNFVRAAANMNSVTDSYGYVIMSVNDDASVVVFDVIMILLYLNGHVDALGLQ